MRILLAIGFVFALGTGCGSANNRQAASGAIEVGSCHVGGCNSELCSDQENMVSPCIFRPEFACYKDGTCAPQRNGQCEWTQTRQLTECLTSGGP